MAAAGALQTGYLGTMQYYVLLPDHYSPDQSYPVILYLHGGGQEAGLAAMLTSWFNTPDFRADYPAIIVAPIIQGSSLYNNWGAYPVGNDDNENQALAILQSVMTQYSGDSSRVYVTGLSLGGHGTWDLLIKDNIYDGTQGRIFAAGMPLAGGWSPDNYLQIPDQATIDELRSVPIWAVQGQYDQPTVWDSTLAADLGPNSAYHFTEPYLGHDVWDTTYPLQYGRPYYDWMFSQAAPSELNLPGNAAVAITGTVSGQTVTDATPSMPFAGVTILERDAAQTETITVTLSAAANGVLSNLGDGSYNVMTGVYTDAGRAASVTAALDGLVFTPASGEAPGQTATTQFTISDTNTAGGSFSDNATSVVAKGTLIGDLSSAQQLELIYLTYFGRAADGAGFDFWTNQETLALAAGKSEIAALSAIADSFAPQPETLALYPFLGKPAAAVDTITLVDSVYNNLFGRPPDATGETYWVDQLTSGLVATGTALLAIANGATGTDAIMVRNRIAVALDFTTRTAAAGLGKSAPLPASFVAAARSVLNGVDGASLNDDSVTAGTNATTGYLGGATSARGTMGVAGDPPAIVISGSGQLIDPGIGDHTIQFLSGTNTDTLVLRDAGVERVSGFDVGTDALDLSLLFREADISPPADATALTRYLTIANIGSDCVISFDPTGQGFTGPVAVLEGLAGMLTNIPTLLADRTIRVT